MYRNIYHYKGIRLTNKMVIGSQSYTTREAALRHIKVVPSDRALYIKTVEVPDHLLLPEWVYTLPVHIYNNSARRVIPL